jgi:hypothetical protein
MSGIDYSKWDRVIVSDSDADPNDAASSRNSSAADPHISVESEGPRHVAPQDGDNVVDSDDCGGDESSRPPSISMVESSDGVFDPPRPAPEASDSESFDVADARDADNHLPNFASFNFPTLGVDMQSDVMHVGLLQASDQMCARLYLTSLEALDARFVTTIAKCQLVMGTSGRQSATHNLSSKQSMRVYDDQRASYMPCLQIWRCCPPNDDDMLLNQVIISAAPKR